jgi:hypothetical protein
MLWFKSLIHQYVKIIAVHSFVRQTTLNVPALMTPTKRDAPGRVPHESRNGKDGSGIDPLQLFGIMLKMCGRGGLIPLAVSVIYAKLSKSSANPVGNPVVRKRIAR